MTEPLAEPGTETRPRILLADDSKVIRTSAARILGEEFDVLLAVDGQDAWDQLKQQDDISAVFTDIGMPYIDGLALLAKIRGHDSETLSTLPVIVVTGDETDEAREDALKRGATDFITKPFNRVDLLARARSHATAERERRELAAYTTID
ncbi:MAG TPA: response regulator, partial [Gammaproteobacteria bacterium]